MSKTPQTAERRNITQPADWWTAFEAEAKRNDETLSEFLGRAGLQALPDAARKRLSPRKARGNPAFSVGK